MKGPKNQNCVYRTDCYCAVKGKILARNEGTFIECAFCINAQERKEPISQFSNSTNENKGE